MSDIPPVITPEFRLGRGRDTETTGIGRGFLDFLGIIPRRYYGAGATGSTDEKEWKRLMFRWYGLTPCRGLTWYSWAHCPHHVGRGRCPRDCTVSRGCYTIPEEYRTLWDHPRAWRNPAGRVVITLEPWGDPFTLAEEYARLTADMGERDIRIGFEGRSPYGASFLLMLMTPEDRYGMSWPAPGA